jgi:hypothetical protein
MRLSNTASDSLMMKNQVKVLHLRSQSTDKVKIATRPQHRGIHVISNRKANIKLNARLLIIYGHKLSNRSSGEKDIILRDLPILSEQRDKGNF